MQCERFESRLNEVLDARRPLSSANELVEHVRQCSSCRELARAYEALLLGLEQAELPPEPAGLAPRVVSQLRSPKQSLPPRSRVLPFPRLGAFAAAAAVVLGVGFTLFVNRGANLDEHGQPAGALSGADLAPGGLQGGRGDQVTRTGPQPRHGRASPSDGRPKTQRGASEAAAPASLTALLDPGQLKADDLIGSLPTAAWAHDVADGLEPVTKPTVGAISGFLQLWGVGDEGRRS